MKLGRQKDRSFVHAVAREWAKKINAVTGKTCSVSTVHKTTLWKQTMEKSGRGRTKGGRTP